LAILKPLGFNQKNIDTVLLLKNGHLYKKSSAILHILKTLNYPWEMFYLLIIIPGFIRDFVYDLVSKTRYSLFGKRDVCRIPSEQERKRFL